MSPSLLPLRLARLSPPLLLLLMLSTPRGPNDSTSASSINFAAATVGETAGGMAVELQQVLPVDGWEPVRAGGCLLGRGRHLVVDPKRSNMEESLADSSFIGGQLCTWLSDMRAHYKRHRARSRRGISGFKSNLFARFKPEVTFQTSLSVTLKHIDLLDFEEGPGINRHIPLPWAKVTFTYFPPTKKYPVHFCGATAFCDKPKSVHILLSPELSEELHKESIMANENAKRLSETVEDYDSDEHVVSEHVSEAFQMLPVRTFDQIGTECVCLDGRLVAKDSGLCTWAQTQRIEFPAASATLVFKSVSLFLSKYALVTGRLQLENPVYRLYKKSVTLRVKPLQSRAVLARMHYYADQ